MPLVLRGFPVVIVAAAVLGIVYFFVAYQKVGKPIKDYYLLPYNLVKDGLKNIFLERGPMMFMVILFFIYCISLFYTTDIDNGLRKILLKSCYLYLPLIFTLTKWDKVKLLRVVDFYILGCVFQVVFSFVDAFIDAGFQFSFKEFSYVELSYNLHPSYAAIMIVVGMVFASTRLIFTLKEKRNWKVILTFALPIILFVVYVVLLSSKAGLITLFLSVITLMIYTFYVLKSWKVVVSVLLIGFLILGSGLFFVGGKATSKFKELFSVTIQKESKSKNRTGEDQIGSTAIRLVLWDNSVNAIKESPLFGYGVGDGKAELQKELSNNGEVFILNKHHNSHNQLLETGLALGGIGVLILLLILFYSAFGYGDFTIISFLLVSVVILNLLTESMMEKQSGSILIVWLLCFLNSGKNIFKSVFSLKS